MKISRIVERLVLAVPVRPAPPAVVRSWVDLASCRGRDTAFWFAPVGSFESAVAVAVCRSCEVRTECLRAALVEEIGVPAVRRYGVRGGVIGAERARLP